MGLLFLTTETQDLLVKLNRVFSYKSIDKMRKNSRPTKFSTDPQQGRSLARCAKHFKLHPGAPNSQGALRWFWLLRQWDHVFQTDFDTGNKSANMADLIRKWIYEGLTTTLGGSPFFKTIIFKPGTSDGAVYATVDRNGDIMTITAYTPDVPKGVECNPPYDQPPPPDANENPPDPDDDPEAGTARRRRAKRAKPKAGQK